MTDESRKKEAKTKQKQNKTNANERKKTLKARERWIDTFISPRASGVTARMLTSIPLGQRDVDSCFGLLSSHKHGRNDNT